MGNSYMKMRFTDYSGGFAYEYPADSGKYEKVTLSVHPDNKFIQSRAMTYNQYYAYGDWYYYDGDSFSLKAIFDDFNPKSQSIGYLVERLKVESSLRKYETTWETLTRWAEETERLIKIAVEKVGQVVLGWTILQQIGWV